MYYNKVEICGVNTAKLPVLTEKEKTELLKLSKSGDKNAREKMIKVLQNRDIDILTRISVVLDLAQRMQDALDNDEIFDELWDFASGKQSDFSYKAAGLGILTYFFEKCEVFEK